MRLIYFSPVPWNSYEQRPHYMVRDFLATADGAQAIWIDPYAARLPGWADLSRQDLREPPLVLPRPAGLTVFGPSGLPIDPLRGGAWLNRRLFWNQLLDHLAALPDHDATIVGVGRPTALALAGLEAIKGARKFYDAMDDFPEFYRGRSAESTRRIEGRIARTVDRILVSSSHLHQKFAAAGPPVTLLRNAFDMDLLPPVSVRDPAPMHLGFVGCLGSWFSWPVVVQLADTVQPHGVTLVGPIAAALPARRPSNISLYPQCTQAESIQYLRAFTVGLIPFAKNALTAGVDPIKYYQYRAAGLPILTTGFGDMAMRGAADGTFFLDDDAGMDRAVAAAAEYQPDAADVARFRAENSWSTRFSDADLWTIK